MTAALMFIAGVSVDGAALYWLARQPSEQRKAKLRKGVRLLLWIWAVQAGSGFLVGLIVPWLYYFNTL